MVAGAPGPVVADCGAALTDQVAFQDAGCRFSIIQAPMAAAGPVEVSLERLRTTAEAFFTLSRFVSMATNG